MRRVPALGVLIALLLTPWSALGAKEAAPARPDYPPTKTGDAFDLMHGERIADPYRWLEPDDTAEVEAWDEAQLALTRRHLDAWPEREAYLERVAREFDVGGMRSLPTFEGGRRWVTYRPVGANHAVLYVLPENDRSAGDPSEAGRVVLDPNTWSEDGTAGMRSWHVSPDGSYVAYLRDERGSEDSSIHIRDVVTGEDLPDVITRAKFSGVTWALDSEGFFYSRLPDPESVPEGEAQYHRRGYFHRLGTPVVDDVMVYGRGRHKLESGWIYRCSDKRHLMYNRGMPYQSVDTFQVHFDGSSVRLVPVDVATGKRTYIDRVGDVYLINSDRDDGRRRLYTAPVLDELEGQGRPAGSAGDWHELAFDRGETGVVDEWSVVDQTWVVALVREHAISRLYVRRLDHSGEAREIVLPGPGTVRDLTTREDDTRLWFRFQSYSLPATNYVVDVAREGAKPRALETMPTTLDVKTLVSERHTYESVDGTEIPLFILRRKDTPLDGSAPTVLYGYGGFRVGLYPGFSRGRGLFAERGGVIAVACLRGGNEYGEEWHQDGCLANKQNVFDDFIAAADYLVDKGMASRARLGIQGGSNGGLLVATCINQRPDLCGAVLCGVPLTDMLRFHRFQYAKSWTKEYGDPDLAEEFAWIRPYSPYHNVQQGAAYPAIMVTSGLRDGRVNTFHARKIVAAWQAATRGADPILLRVDRDSGHGSASIKQYIAELVDEHSFLFMRLGGAE